MGFFDHFKSADINAGVKQFRETEKAVLLDVRTPEEYREGHIPGSINVPLQDIESAAQIIEDRETPLFVHCLSGGRSRRAVSALNRMGYTKVINIGGISDYRGNVDKGA